MVRHGELAVDPIRRLLREFACSQTAGACLYLHNSLVSRALRGRSSPSILLSMAKSRDRIQRRYLITESSVMTMHPSLKPHEVPAPIGLSTAEVTAAVRAKKADIACNP